MKRTCNGCRALQFENLNPKCELGYEIEAKHDSKNHFTVSAKPKEECPKPKTVDEYYRLVMLGHGIK